MTRLGLLASAWRSAAATPSLAQTVGPCPGKCRLGRGVQAELGIVRSRERRREARGSRNDRRGGQDRQGPPGSTKVCVVGQTDKLGDKNYNAKLAQQRSQAVASELIKAGYPAKDVGDRLRSGGLGQHDFGGNDASEKDRRVTIIPR